jgi:hypothetical protein
MSTAATRDAVLAQLRLDGFSPVESIEATRAVLHVSLGKAKQIVQTGEEWSDARKGFERRGPSETAVGLLCRRVVA